MPAVTALPADAPPADPAEPTGGLDLLGLLTRRWPLILVGLVAGAAVGVLVHLQKPPEFASAAQVMVIRQGFGGPRGDDRASLVEDYVSTQVTLLRSQYMLSAAARQIPTDPGPFPLPAGEDGRMAVLANGLSVARQKEPGTTGSTGGGVLSLSFRGGDPVACKVLLEAVIKAYQEELANLYDDATRQKLQTNNEIIRVRQQDLQKALDDRGLKYHELRQVTEEDLVTVRARLSAMRERRYQWEDERIDLGRKLAAIERAGNNPSRRLAVLIELSGEVNGRPFEARYDPSSPQAQLPQLQAEREFLLDSRGEDHPEVKAVDRKIGFYRRRLVAAQPDLGPSPPAGLVDDLWALEQKLKVKKEQVDEKLQKLKAEMPDVAKVVVSADKVSDDIRYLSARIDGFNRDIDRLQTERKEIEATQALGGYRAKVLTPPGFGGKVGPLLAKSLVLWLVVGGLAGGGLGLLAELSDQGFKSPAEVRKRLGLAVIGHLPRLAMSDPPADSPYPALDPKLVVAHLPKSPAAEAYRGVRTQLYFSTRGRGHQIIQVTSPNPGDGKSTLTANLAVAVAQTGKRAVLVDADFRKPRVHTLFGLDRGEVGLAAVVAGEADLPAALRPSGVPGLDLLTCGPRPGNPAELLTSPGFQAALDELRAGYDFVLLDTPPALAVSDPAVVAPRADGIVLVLRMTKRSRPTAEQAKEHLQAVGGNIIGVAVNGLEGGADQYGYGYGYTYRYQYQYDYEYADDPADDPHAQAAAP